MVARIYVRKSSDTGIKGEVSLEDQEAGCRKRAAEEGETEIVLYNEGQGVSASKNLAYLDPGSRPALTRLLNEVQRGDLVIAWEASRLGRDEADAHITAREIGKRHAHVVTLDGSDTRRGMLDLSARIMLSAEESRRLSERVSAGKRRQREAGRFMGGVPPFGFRKDADGKLEPEPSEAAICREIVERMTAGESYRSVAAWLTASGVETRGKANEWTATTVGKFIRRDGLEALVGHEAAMRARAVARRRGKRGGRYNPRTHPLTGVLKCALCGRGFVFDSSTGSGGAYRCAGIPKRACKGSTVSSGPYTAFIVHALVWRLSDANEEEDREALVQTIRERLAVTLDPGPEHERDVLSGELATLDARIDDIQAGLRSGNIPARMAGSILTPMEEEREAILAKLAAIVPATTRAFDTFLSNLMGSRGDEALKLWADYPTDVQRNLLLAVWPGGIEVYPNPGGRGGKPTPDRLRYLDE